MDSTPNEDDSTSVSITFYFSSEPPRLPDFLVGKRGKSPRVVAYGPEQLLVSGTAEERSRLASLYLKKHLETAISNGVDPHWLTGLLRVEVTPDVW